MIYKAQNYVVLCFSPNPYYLGLEELNIRHLPPDMITVDVAAEHWTWQDNFQRESQIVRFGEARRIPPERGHWGTIGVFDRTNIQQLQAMVKVAREIGRPYDSDHDRIRPAAFLG